MTTQPTSLSGFWRVNKSRDRAVELKQLQESLQSLAGTLAKSKGKDIRVVWDQTLSSLYVDHKKTSVFTLDASPIIDTASPVPDSRVDVLAGQVLHHVGHMVAPVREVMRQKIINNIFREHHFIGDRYSNCYKELGIISQVIQEWQIDTYLSSTSPAIREYISAARSWYRDAAQDRIQEAIDACAAENPTFKEVVDLWSLILCYNLPVPNQIDPKVADALVDAISKSGKLAKHPRYIDSVTQAIWQAFNPFTRVREEPKDESTQGEGSQDGSTEDERAGDQGSSDSGAETDREFSRDQSSDMAPPSEGRQDEDGSEGTDDDAEGEASESEDEEGEESSEDTDDEGETDEAEGERGEGESPTALDEQKPQECPTCGEEDLFDSDAQTCQSCGYSEAPPDIDSTAPGYFASAIDQPQAHLDQEEIQDLKDAIESEKEDIAGLLGASYSGPVIMQLAPDDQELAQRLMAESQPEANALSDLFRNWRRAKTRYIRGLENGSLDRRLLYRGGMKDSHVFRSRDIVEKLDMALCVLIDASSSIKPDAWDIIRHCAAAFVQSMGNRTDVDVIVLGYNSQAIYRVWDPSRRQFRIGFSPTSSTPTTQAIAACQNVIFQRYSRHKDKLIIHISDAFANDPSDATKQIVQAKKSGIQVALVRTPVESYYNDPKCQQHIDESYGRSHVDIKDWHDLPSAMESLMRIMLAQR
jgi:hypothetical protein